MQEYITNLPSLPLSPQVFYMLYNDMYLRSAVQAVVHQQPSFLAQHIADLGPIDQSESSLSSQPATLAQLLALQVSTACILIVLNVNVECKC